MSKREAREVVLEAVKDFIFEGGTGAALVGHDRLSVLRLADALDALDARKEAESVRSEGAAMTYEN